MIAGNRLEQTSSPKTTGWGNKPAINDIVKSGVKCGEIIYFDILPQQANTVVDVRNVKQCEIDPISFNNHPKRAKSPKLCAKLHILCRTAGFIKSGLSLWLGLGDNFKSNINHVGNSSAQKPQISLRQWSRTWLPLAENDNKFAQKRSRSSKIT